MVKSIVNTVGTKFLSAAFNFFIILITANYLGTEGRGQISLLIASITIVLLFANFVGGNTLIFLTPRKPISELLFVSYLWTLLTVILAFLSMYFFHVFDFNYCLHISLLSLLFSFTAIHISILLGKENIETANKITLFQVIAHFFLLGICFIFFEMNTDSVFIFSLYVTYGIAFLLSAFYLKNFIDKSVTFKLSDTLRMAFTIGALAQTANIFQFLNYRLDIYLLHNYDSLSNLGIYSTTVSLAEAALLFGSSFALVQFSKIANTQNENQNRELTIKLTRYSILLTLIAYFPLFIFPDEFYSFLLGKDFYKVRDILLALSPGIILLGSSVTLSHYFAGIGKYKFNAWASLAGLLVTLVLGLIFIPEYGFIGAAWVSSISYGISTLVLLLSFILQTKTKVKELIPTISDLKFLQKSILNVRNSRNS